jgi:hypothetical protein
MFGGAMNNGNLPIRLQRKMAHDEGWTTHYAIDSEGNRVLHDYCPRCTKGEAPKCRLAPAPKKPRTNTRQFVNEIFIDD